MDIDNHMILRAIARETAAKVVANLDGESKKAVIAEAVSRILENLKIEWEINDIIRDEARMIAQEYIKEPSMQDRIRDKVLEAVEKVMDGLAKTVAKETERTLKEEYRSWS